MDITHLISHNSNPLNKQKPPSPLPISPRHETLTYTHLQKRQSLPHMMTPPQVHRGQDHHLPPFLSPPLSHASQPPIRENINSGFEELKSIVPSCRGCADSKAIILRKAAHYIQALEAQIQKLKQSSSGSTTPNTSSVTTPPLVSPVMSVKSIPSGHIHMHGGVNGNSMYAINEFNQRIGEEKKLQQQLEQQKFMGQWQTNRLNHQNYLPPESSSYQQQQSNQSQQQQQHNNNNNNNQHHHQRNLSYPIPRHHSQYHYSHHDQQQLKTENMDWIPGGDKNHHHHYNNYETKIHQPYHRNYHPYHSDINSSPSRTSSPHSMGR
ncbi:1740_t:CDS:2 [Cetraspora pellucida]|uniref:1740_t:CDS:1 n=1 Tax=Cetraspora pellucida TaxID=1433469 RepID=A0A9N8ZE01_9GLOM|nr:1740_t:CDS:2 [Cetraspora pellucida]